MKYSFLFFLMIFVGYSGFSQGVVISNNAGETPDPSAMLEIKSTTQGLLIPRMTTVQRNTLSATAVDGLLIFDSDRQSFFIFGNSKWTDLSMSAEIWSKSASNVYLTNSTDNIGVGTSTPGSKFVIQASTTDARDDVLFEVIGTDGIPVFEVTTNGVKISVNGDAKAVSRGFAVGQYNSAKATVFKDFFTVDNLGNSRVHLHDDGTKAISGGFAVGQYNSAKGYTPVEEYLNVAPDLTQVNNTLPSGKAVSGGFAVGQYNSAKGRSNFMQITPENYFIGHDAGLATIPGTDPNGLYNIFLGFESGLSNTTGYQNTYVGHLTGRYQKYGTDNVFLGNGAGEGLLSYTGTSERNVILGAGAGNLLDGAIDNVFIGHLAGEGFLGTGVTGDYNVIIGESAGRHIISGAKNVFLGYQAGFSNIGGQKNIFIGDQAGYTNMEADNNVFIGIKAGYSMIKGSSSLTGNDNVFIGNNAGRDNDSTLYNTMIGTDAGMNSGGGFNTFIGKSSGKSSKADYNTYLGTSTATYNETGTNNVVIGHYANFWSTGGSRNVIIGQDAAALAYGETIGSGNVLIGNSVANDAVGIANKLYVDNSRTSEPLIWGDFSTEEIHINGDLTFNKGTTNSVTLPLTRGTSNQVLTSAGNGTSNWETVANNLITADNGLNFEGTKVELGGTLNESTTITQGGYRMNFNLTGTGDFNVQDNGVSAFFVRDNGNIGIGTTAPSYKLDVAGPLNLNKGLNNVALRVNGAEAIWYSGAHFSWGYGGTANYFADNVGIGTTSPSYNLQVSGTNPVIAVNDLEISDLGSSNLGLDGDIVPYSSTGYDIGNNAANEHWDQVVAVTYVTYSDKNTKNAIKELKIGLNEILQLKPVTYIYNKDISADERVRIGLIAQDVEGVIPQVVFNEDVDIDPKTGQKIVVKGQYKVLNYDQLIPVLINGIQEQNSEIENLKQQIQELRELILKK